ncbi:putative ABC transporter permease YvcS [Collibacillus ludicampi]|uniref:ABC transporter permease YvcS n=1 Tax=Collibacillus ludicampi TaxID=2771369 RepID=A0AAV4LEU8_9BACL|nr:ABC transporter permease [Collibacillus ludicampi]GIM46204.1 putative ABC transporter permease YvcS [Collibacillus ludicampi]
MKFHQLALKNVRGNWHRYSAFFLSSVFSVMIFYMYAAFLFHPDVVNGQMVAAKKVAQGLVICEYIIMIFSFFFVLYSISAFLKSRKKEFGLLKLFGMTTGQIKRLVILENTCISLLAIVTGIGFGVLFSKLFFMALSTLLGVTSPIRFAVPPKAVLFTAAGFVVLFQVITLVTLIQVGRSEIIELLHEARKPKRFPVFSKWLVLLSVVCLGSGYSMAYIMNIRNLMLFMLPVVFLVILGTYFLFTQSSVALLRRLQRNRSVYYRNTNLITISQLVFKMKDNARILFMVSILSAVVLTASGTIYCFFQGLVGQLTKSAPQTFSFVEKGLHQHQLIDPRKVEDILQKDRVGIEYKVEWIGIPVPLELGRNHWKTTGLIISEGEYNEQAKRLNLKERHLEEGHAISVYPYGSGGFTLFEKGSTFKTSLGKQPLKLTIDEEISETVVNPVAEATYLFVVNNTEYKQLMSQLPDQEKVTVYGYELKNWKSTNETVKKIEQAIPDQQKERFYSRVQSYLDMRQFTSLTLFIGIFVSFLFFLASGSMIYFKLFTEMQDDQNQFRALTRIGMTEQEIRRIVSAQVAILFFVPCIVGIIHMMFAMKSLGNLLSSNVIPYAFVVILIFIVMQSLYFFAARRTYMKKILQETV